MKQYKRVRSYARGLFLFLLSLINALKLLSCIQQGTAQVDFFSFFAKTNLLFICQALYKALLRRFCALEVMDTVSLVVIILAKNGAAGSWNFVIFFAYGMSY